MAVAGYTFKELQDEVLDFQFSDTNYRSLVKVWLNSAQQTAVIQSQFRTQETSEAYATTSADATYTVPDDFSRLIDLYDSDVNQLLSPLSKLEFDSLAASSGRPTNYTVVGDQLTLYPTPDGIYNLALRYYRLPPDMVDDADVPEIPAQYHDLLIAYAMQKAYARENDYSAANYWAGEWTNGLMKMRGEVQSDFFDGPSQVAGSWGDPHERGAASNVWR